MKKLIFKNIPQLIALVKRYESITQEEIDNADITGIETYHGRLNPLANALTGFGKMTTCTLCIAILGEDAIKEDDASSLDCSKCVYHELQPNAYKYSCIEVAKETYDAIDKSSEVDLLKAYRNRAKAIRKAFKEYDINFD